MVNQTAERLKKLSPKIMEEWEKRTLEEVKAAGLQDTLALRNSLPVYLSQLVDALSNTIERTDSRNESDQDDSTRIGKKHGRERAVASEYTMDQMIFEYHILRQVICNLMEDEAPLSRVEREVIVSSIEQAVNDAATQFSDTLRDFQEHLSHTLAHDIRSPLSTLKLSAQMLTKQLTDKGHLDKLERILHGADRIDGMIHEVLDESRMNAIAKKPLELTEFDLEWLVRDTAYELNISNKDRFQVESTGKCMGKWNESFLRRIIENLGTNAIKHGNDNTHVTLSVSQTKDLAIIKVHNIGNAIPKDEQSFLFQKFKRGSSAERKIGWGIGLSVVKTMVDALRGSIDVESDESKGTTFIVKIPKN